METGAVTAAYLRRLSVVMSCKWLRRRKMPARRAWAESRGKKWMPSSLRLESSYRVRARGADGHRRRRRRNGHGVNCHASPCRFAVGVEVVPSGSICLDMRSAADQACLGRCNASDRSMASSFLVIIDGVALRARVSWLRGGKAGRPELTIWVTPSVGQMPGSGSVST